MQPAGAFGKAHPRQQQEGEGRQQRHHRAYGPQPQADEAKDQPERLLYRQEANLVIFYHPGAASRGGREATGKWTAATSASALPLARIIACIFLHVKEIEDTGNTDQSAR